MIEANKPCIYKEAIGRLLFELHEGYPDLVGDEEAYSVDGMNPPHELLLYLENDKPMWMLEAVICSTMAHYKDGVMTFTKIAQDETLLDSYITVRCRDDVGSDTWDFKHIDDIQKLWDELAIMWFVARTNYMTGYLSAFDDSQTLPEKLFHSTVSQYRKDVVSCKREQETRH